MASKGAGLSDFGYCACKTEDTVFAVHDRCRRSRIAKISQVLGFQDTQQRSNYSCENLHSRTRGDDSRSGDCLCVYSWFLMYQCFEK